MFGTWSFTEMASLIAVTQSGISGSLLCVYHGAKMCGFPRQINAFILLKKDFFQILSRISLVGQEKLFPITII